MKITKLLIWIISFSIAIGIGKLVIRNYWRLYLSEVEMTLRSKQIWQITFHNLQMVPRTVLIQDVSEFSPSISFYKDHTGRCQNEPFIWEYLPNKNELWLNGIGNSFLDGQYRVTIKEGGNKLILKSSQNHFEMQDLDSMCNARIIN